MGHQTALRRRDELWRRADPRWRSLASLPVSLAPLAAQSPSARRGEAPRAVPMCVTPVSEIKDQYPARSLIPRAFRPSVMARNDNAGRL